MDTEMDTQWSWIRDYGLGPPPSLSSAYRTGFVFSAVAVFLASFLVYLTSLSISSALKVAEMGAVMPAYPGMAWLVNMALRRTRFRNAATYKMNRDLLSVRYRNRRITIDKRNDVILTSTFRHFPDRDCVFVTFRPRRFSPFSLWVMRGINRIPRCALVDVPDTDEVRDALLSWLAPQDDRNPALTERAVFTGGQRLSERSGWGSSWAFRDVQPNREGNPMRMNQTTKRLPNAVSHGCGVWSWSWNYGSPFNLGSVHRAYRTVLLISLGAPVVAFGFTYASTLMLRPSIIATAMAAALPASIVMLRLTSLARNRTRFKNRVAYELSNSTLLVKRGYRSFVIDKSTHVIVASQGCQQSEREYLCVAYRRQQELAQPKPWRLDDERLPLYSLIDIPESQEAREALLQWTLRDGGVCGS